MRKLLILGICLISISLWAARTFNGTTDLASANGGPSTPIDLNNQNSISISAWIYMPTVQTVEGEPMAKCSATSGLCAFHISVSHTLKNAGVYFRSQLVANHDVFVDCTTTTLQNNTWYNVVGTYISVAGTTTAAIYLNGVLCSSGSRTAAAISDADGANLTIGTQIQKPPNPNLWFTGTVAEVGVWNQGLTASEIASVAKVCLSSPRAPRRAALVGYWPLWGASGTSPEPDVSGSVLNAALTGTTVANHPPCTP